MNRDPLCDFLFFSSICWCGVNGKMWDLCNFTLGTNCNSSCRVSLPIHSKLLKKRNLKTWHCFPKKLQNQHFWNSFQWKFMKTVRDASGLHIALFPLFSAHCAYLSFIWEFCSFFTDLLDLWTQKASGCTCPDDVLDNSCPCCVSNGCQCTGLKSQRCGQCGLEQYCDESKYIASND